MKNVFQILFFLLLTLRSFSQGLFISGSAYVVQKGGSASNPSCVIINQASVSGITRTGGGIVNQDNNENNYLVWMIGTGAAGNYTLPWYNSSYTPNYIPFTYGVTSSGTGSGRVLFSTWQTQADNTTAVAGGITGRPSGVANMFDGYYNDNSLYCADRFWWVKYNGYTTPPAASLTFYYTDAEIAPSNSITETNLMAQYWNGTSWVNPGAGTDTPSGNYVSGAASQSSNVPWVLSDNRSPLPIELLSYTATCRDDEVVLNWATASETNNNYFTIEKSADAVNWEILTTVGGAGTSNAPNYYSAFDSQPYSDVSYYRLKQTDFDGTFTYSPVISSSCGSDEPFNVQVIALNASHELQLTFSAEEGESYVFSLYDIQGKLLVNKSESTVAGTNEVHVILPEISEGIYLIALQNSKKFFGQKILLK